MSKIQELSTSIERYSPTIELGLTEVQVAKRIEDGLTNTTKKKYSKSYLNIFTKYKYDRRSGKPLKQTDYGLSDSRKPWHQTIWTYE
jgi:hypothetical protein